MTISSRPATPSGEAAAPFDALAPLRFPADLRLTPEQFALVCAENREAVLELAADGRLIAMTPTGSETGARNSRLIMRLALWADQQGGWKVFGSSAGFRLPDGSVLSPDASLVRLDRWEALSAEERRGFAPLCPDLVVELASPGDEGPRAARAGVASRWSASKLAASSRDCLSTWWRSGRHKEITLFSSLLEASITQRLP